MVLIFKTTRKNHIQKNTHKKTKKYASHVGSHHIVIAGTMVITERQDYSVIGLK